MRARAHGILALALFLLLLPLPAHAGPTVSLVASRMELSGGSGATAALAGAHVHAGACGGVTLTGTAAYVRIDVETFHTPLTLNTDQAVVPLVPGEPGGDRHEARNATVTVRDLREGCRILAWTPPGLEASVAFPAGSLAFTPASPVVTSHQVHTSNRKIPLGGPDLLEATAQPGLATVQGGLNLSLWRATLEVREPGKPPVQWVLGEEDRPVAPVEPAPDAVTDKVESEAFVTLTGAQLTLALPAGLPLLASRAHVDAPAGHAQFHDALIDPEVELVPLLNITAPLGDLRAKDLKLVGDFAPGTASRTERGAFGPASPVSLWALAAGAPLAVVAAASRRWALQGMRKAADDDACERAARLALAVWPPNAESRTTRVVCLLRLGRLDAAARALHPRRWRSQRATRSFLLARLEASRGDAAAARRHLADCFLLAPAFVADARADLALHGIVEAALARVHDLQAASREGYA